MRAGAQQVVMGRVVGPWGVQGWIRVQPYSGDPAGLLQISRWQLVRRGVSSEVEIQAARAHAGHVIAKVQGLQDRDAALALRGAEVVVTRDTLPEPEPGQFYWADLVGLQVVNNQSEALGEVLGLFENGAHDVIEVGPTPKRLVPWTAVQKVEMAAGRIVVDWGLDW